MTPFTVILIYPPQLWESQGIPNFYLTKGLMAANSEEALRKSRTEAFLAQPPKARLNHRPTDFGVVALFQDHVEPVHYTGGVS